MGRAEAAEAASLLDGTAAEPAPQRAGATDDDPVRSILLGVALVGGVCVVAVSLMVAMPGVNLSSGAARSPRIRVAGEYGAAAGDAYPWIKDGSYDAVVEPFAPTTLRLEDAPAGAATVTWALGEGRSASGHAVNATFERLASYEIVAVAVDATGARVATKKATVLCRYVRREIRQLTAEHRNRFLDAASVLWSCRNCSDVYGPAYLDAYELTRKHAALAGDRTCDHMHDGLGFLTMHLGLSLAFEQSVQAVDARVAMPYWDFTIDRARVDAGTWSSLDESDLWRSDWFGSADASESTVTEGRWAYLAAESGAWDSPTRNSYGFLRAPWNNNNRPYVTRSKTLCGTAFTSTPTCGDHFDVVNGTATWYDFGWALPYAPHGSVHQYVGGTLECNETNNDLLSWLTRTVDESIYTGFSATSSDLTYLLRTDMFLMLKNLFRLEKLSFPEYCSTDTPYSDCHGTCDASVNLKQALAHNNTGAVEEYWGEMMAWDTAITGTRQTISSRYDWLDEDLKVDVMARLCDGGFGVDGDHLEAASPLDPSFWPIHPTLERLYVYKMLAGGFENATWPSTGYASSDDCYGHGASDLVPFQFSLKDDDAPVFYTNVEILALASPESPTLPYVFADFDWDHCVEFGYDFASLLRVP